MSNNSNISTHSHNISFAVFRVSRLVRHSKLRKELEASAVELVREITQENADSLTRLVSLSESVGEINHINADVLRREINDLNIKIHSATAVLPIPHEGINIEELFDSKYEDEKPKEESVPLNPEDRQEAVFQFIRQLPNDCRMKDLISEFPDVSERTLRSDIQKLIEEGLVERFGSKSGPLSYLRVTDITDITDAVIDVVNVEEAIGGVDDNIGEKADNILLSGPVSDKGRMGDF